MLMSSRIRYRLLVKDNSASAAYSVSRVVVSTQPNSEAAATISNTAAVVSMVSSVTL